MWKTSVLFISLVIFVNCCLIQVQGQDTIPLPLKIRIGMEASGPVIFYTNKNTFNAEGYIAVDLDEKRSAFFSAGYLNFKYSQYNYSYLSKGSFIRAGMDFNLLKPDKSLGKYWAGIGLRYGLSRFSTGTPFLEKANYWGTVTSSLPQKNYWGHFIEASPGVRAEIFSNFSLGWSVSVRMLIHTGTGKDLRPVNIPGFGNGTKTVTAALSYYLVYNIPYKKIKAIIRKETKEDTEENSDTNTNNSNTGTSGSRQQGNTIRQ